MANKNTTNIKLQENNERLNTLNQESLVNALTQEEDKVKESTVNMHQNRELQDVSLWQAKNAIAPHIHTMILVSKGWQKGKEVTEQEYLSSLKNLEGVKNGK